MTKNAAPSPTYTQRNKLLLELGFLSYAQYLASEIWAEIRNDVLYRDNHCCKLCNNRTVIVHHIDYNESTLLGLTGDGLVSICHECHKKVEFTKQDKKRPLICAQREFNRLMKRKMKLADRKPRSNERPRKYIKSSKPRCVCGNFRKKNKRMCKVCDPKRTPCSL